MGMIRDITHGIINALILAPVLVSFAAIIFKDQAFVDELPRLVKLVLVSGIVHQLVFVFRSSLPFAVGSVQDAGLIFLSSMASTVVQYCLNEGIDTEVMLSTTCVLLSLFTSLLGLCLIIVGKLKIANLVQYLPMPVIGGYLAYIGLFCGQAGLAFMAGVDVDNFRQWHQFANTNSIQLIFPGVLAGIMTYIALNTIRSTSTFPVCLMLILIAFFTAMRLSGSTLDDARVAGWVPVDSSYIPVQNSWMLFNLEPGGVAWGVVPYVIPTFLAMFFVVAFSSCLDVAAIEMELGKPLDYNKELCVVGLSNLLSGMSGGFTGSYIFSQTIFNLRAGVNSRLAGVVGILLQSGIVLVPVNIISYLPKAFFGSLLVLIALDLMIEWLWKSRHRMTWMEYFVCIFTFGAAVATSVVQGLLMGVLAAVFAFALTYAVTTLPTAVTPRLTDSSVMRTFEERRVLKAHRGQVLVLTIRGYCFFGTAIRLLEQVKSHLSNADKNASLSLAQMASDQQIKTIHPALLSDFSVIFNRGGVPTREEGVTNDKMGDSQIDECTPLVYRRDSLNKSRSSFIDLEDRSRSMKPLGNGARSYTDPCLAPIRFVILDFKEVAGIDATAARVCFLMLNQLLQSRAASLVFTEVRESILVLLKAHRVITSDDAVFDTLDNALEWCEEQLLQSAMQRVNEASTCQPNLSPSDRADTGSELLGPEEDLIGQNMAYYAHASDLRSLEVQNQGIETEPSTEDDGIGSLKSILHDYLEINGMDLKSRKERMILEGCMKYFKEESASANEVLFSEKDPSTKLYFIKSGVVELQSLVQHAHKHKDGQNNTSENRRRLLKISVGGTFGEIGFFLNRPQPFRAIASSHCILFTLNRPDMTRMQNDNPALCALAQAA